MRFGLSLLVFLRGVGWVGLGDADDLCGAVLWGNKIEGEECGVMEAKGGRMVSGAGCGVWVTEDSVIYCDMIEQGVIQQKRVLAVSDRSRIVQVTRKNRSLRLE